MECPKCSGTLEPIYIGDVELDRCHVCEGLWFDPGELETVLEKYSSDIKNILFDSALFDGKNDHGHINEFNDKRGDCPKCKSKMFYRKYGEVTADACPRDHGIWLDGGEVFALKKDEEKNYFGLLKHIFFFRAGKKISGRSVKTAQ